jgi:hypothetical protein
MRPLAWYALGVGTAVVAKVTGRPVAKASRPLIRSAIKGGIILNREVQRLTEEARSSLSDLAAEAKADLDATDAGAPETAGPQL